MISKKKKKAATRNDSPFTENELKNGLKEPVRSSLGRKRKEREVRGTESGGLIISRLRDAASAGKPSREVLFFIYFSTPPEHRIMFYVLLFLTCQLVVPKLPFILKLIILHTICSMKSAYVACSFDCGSFSWLTIPYSYNSNHSP